MKNKIVSIVLAIMLVIALAGNVVLFNRLSKENVNSNDYQAAMSQLVVLQTDLDHANETIATLQNEISDMENVISTNTSNVEVPAEEEMLEGLSAELNEEQQAAATDNDIPVNKDTENKNGNNNNNNNNNNNGNNGNSGNNSSQQQQSNPDIDAWMKEMIENGVPTTLPPVTEPDRPFGDNSDLTPEQIEKWGSLVIQ